MAGRAQYFLHNIAAVERAMKQVIEDKSSAAFLFLANRDSKTNEFWCPDCRVAYPIINKAAPSFPIHEVFVGDRGEWKDPANPFRHHELFKVSGVPTLLVLKNGKEQGRLGDAECQQQHKVEALFQRGE